MKYECEGNGSTIFKGRTIRYVRGENDVPKGSLDHVGSCRVVGKQKTAVVEQSDKRDYPIHTHAGWYELSNGEKVRGKEEAIKAQEELDA